jgi:hypothetical protein
VYFARSPGSDVWVCFYDLPKAVRDRLWARICAGEFTDDLTHPFADPTDDNKMTKEQWLAVRKEAALQIDPETALVWRDYGQILDPYGVDPDLPEECQCIGRVYFARSPGSDVWVCFYDLPKAVRDRLRERYHAGEIPDATYKRDPRALARETAHDALRLLNEFLERRRREDRA